MARMRGIERPAQNSLGDAATKGLPAWSPVRVSQCEEGLHLGRGTGLNPLDAGKLRRDQFAMAQAFSTRVSSDP
jgi:hypothetical protein